MWKGTHEIVKVTLINRKMALELQEAPQTHMVMRTACGKATLLLATLASLASAQCPCVYSEVSKIRSHFDRISSNFSTECRTTTSFIGNDFLSSMRKGPGVHTYYTVVFFLPVS